MMRHICLVDRMYLEERLSPSKVKGERSFKFIYRGMYYLSTPVPQILLFGEYIKRSSIMQKSKITVGR